ncbi:MAG: ribonuclease PH [Candidatus Xenobia bacterium]|jgi:ribonuclease PH
MTRADGRNPSQIRPVSFELNYAPFAEGSVLISAGSTRVLCAATLEERIPTWMAEKKRGWVTAEYAMLPRATMNRTNRERSRNSGRTHEIQRLIGRSLRAVTWLEKLGERQVICDCDVIQADAGTRTAAITGSWVALAQVGDRLLKNGLISEFPLHDQVAAVSVGLVDGEVLVDLDYTEDTRAQVDLNLVMTGRGQLVEVQGTAEGAPFSRSDLNRMLDAGWAGLERLFLAQRQALETAGVTLPFLAPA